MKTRIGEEGTEQFSVETRVDGKVTESRVIHDPLVSCRTVVKISRLGHLLGLFRPRTVTVETQVRGSAGAVQAILALDPVLLQGETSLIEARMSDSRSRASLAIQSCYETNTSPANPPGDRPAIWRLGTDLAAEESYGKKIRDAYHKE